MKNTHGSPTFTSKICVAFFMFCILGLFVASLKPARAADTPIEITLSIQVQEILKKSPPARKERLRKAIWVGNKLFMQLLDLSAYDQTVVWLKKTGVLLEMKPERFNWMVDEWHQAHQSLIVCPNIRLVELMETAKDEVDISYQATRMGVLISEGAQFNEPKPSIPYSDHYSTEGKGEFHRVQLHINANNKVADIILQDKLPPEFYKNARLGLKSSNLRKPIYMGETSALVQARVASYDQAIKEMDRSAAEVCESTSFNINANTKEK